MAKSKRQPPWDIYESVVLLDHYLKYRQNNISRAEAIREVSDKLRRMAQNRGVEIDSIYRNIIGISHMFYRIDSAYQGKTIVEPASKNLIDTVAFYRADVEKYKQTLNDAYRLIDGEPIQTPKNISSSAKAFESLCSGKDDYHYIDVEDWIDIMGKRQPPLDRYEAVILLEGYFEIQKKTQPRIMMVKKISNDLRQLGRYRHIDVDDVYRNENGVSFLLSMMQAAYTGKGSPPPSKNFIQTVALYRNDPDAYQAIYHEAQIMISKQEEKISFHQDENKDTPPINTDDRHISLHSALDNLSDEPLIDSTDPTLLEFLEIMAKHQPPWDIYETSILLEGYLQIRQNAAPRAQIIKEISEHLRQMGRNRGVAVDDVYRNTSGISYQLQRMDSAVKGKTVFVPTSKCFSETVALYRNAPNAFQNILNDAKRMIEGKTIPMPCDIDTLLSELSEDLITGDCDAMTTVNQPPWEIYEVVYLETTFFNLRQQGELAPRILTRLASDFKKMGTARGIPVDNTYRNRAEIFQKLRSYLALCQGNPTHPIDPVIKAAFQLKYHDRDAYLRAFDYAKQLIENASTPHNCPPLADVDSIQAAENSIETNNHSIETNNHSIETNNHSIETNNHSIETAGNNRQTDKNTISPKDNANQTAENAAPVRQLTYRGTVLPDDINQILMQKIHIALTSIQDFVQCAERVLYQNTSDDIRRILKQHYSGGFPYTSARLMRNFRAKAEEMHVTLPDDDECLRQKMESVGTIIDGKIYVPDDALFSDLQQWMENIFQNYHVAFDEPLYNAHIDWLNQHHILTKDVLRVFLTQTQLDCTFDEHAIIKGSNPSLQTAIVNDIKNAWGSEPLESVESLGKRLIYIPEEEVRQTLNHHDDFLHMYSTTYINLDRFVMTPEDNQRIFDYIESACERDGYALVSELPIDHIAEMNDQLNTKSIQAIILKKILSPSKYFVKQRIITKNYVDAPVTQLQKNYLRDKDSCCFDDLLDYTSEVIGEHNRYQVRQWTFDVLYNNMIRTDERDYISSKYVNFDIKAVDHILSSYIPDHFIALAEIPTFIDFPYCGIAWNHYVLGSFCYRYSDKYKLCLLYKFNNSNIGIIAEKDFQCSYDEMIALALARSSLTDLSLQSCKLFLGDNGYTSGRDTIDDKTILRYAQNAEQLRRR